ncbi:hypothetical protein RJ55_07259 [Drechmeria coniospora]|nr:hypothetical protein RJ55_07259 [Drechmeria coniospora]
MASAPARCKGTSQGIPGQPEEKGKNGEKTTEPMPILMLHSLAAIRRRSPPERFPSARPLLALQDADQHTPKHARPGPAEEAYARYEEAAAEIDLIERERQVEEEEEEDVADNRVTLDPLQQARKRRQRLAAIAASATRGKRTKLTSELDEFMARTNKADLEVEDPLEWWVRHTSD